MASIVLSVPTRYIHSHNGIIHRQDYEAAVQLVLELLKSLDHKKIQELLS